MVRFRTGLPRKSNLLQIEQHPVGQGGFHSGSFGESSPYTYVYDCGAMSSRNLRAKIEQTFPPPATVHTLFLSHLDNDHVNGIDALSCRCEVHTVVLPYFDAESILLQLARQVGSGDFSTSYLDFLIDPTAWLQRRGVRRIWMIEPDTDDGEEVSAPDPIEPGGTFHEEKDGSRATWRLGAAKPEFLSPSGVTLQGRGSVLVIALGMQTWIIRPYVHVLAKETHSLLAAELKNKLGLGTSLDHALLAARLRDRTTINKLRQVYTAYVSANRNFISMSLFSGPHANSELIVVDGHGYGHRSPCPGWLLTGDAELQLHNVRKRWRSFFAPHEQNVGFLMLPHHGSDKNFNDEILDFPALNQVFVTANPNAKHHPGPVVRRHLSNRYGGSDAWIVTKDEERRLIATYFEK